MKLVYLAPEIPALSATFVYNELLAVEALGHEITPVSVHRPQSIAKEKKLASLSSRVAYLYEVPKLNVLRKQFKCLLTRPKSYFNALFQCLSDIFQVGVCQRDSMGLIYRFFYSAVLADLIQQKQIDHIHVHFAHVPTDIAMYASSMTGVPYSVMAHANDIFERGLLLNKKVERSHFFATISDFNRRYILSKYQVDENKLSIIRCGVDADVFLQKQDREKLHMPIKLGTVGRLVEKKGLDTLIESVSILAEYHSNVILEIAGSGPLQKELESFVKQLGLDKFVRFIGALSHDKVADFVSSLDVFILPCKQDKNGDMDGIPVVLMEAMMVGTPVISSNLSGIPELVIHNKTGLLIEQGNSRQLADTIIKLVGDESLRKDLTNEAISKVKTEFSQDVNARRLVELILKH